MHCLAGEPVGFTKADWLLMIRLTRVQAVLEIVVYAYKNNKRFILF